MYIDCPACGQTEHESKFRTCLTCEQYICKWCRDNTHECHSPYIYTEEETNEAYTRELEDEQGDGKMSKKCKEYVKSSGKCKIKVHTRYNDYCDGGEDCPLKRKDKK